MNRTNLETPPIGSHGDDAGADWARLSMALRSLGEPASELEIARLRRNVGRAVARIGRYQMITRLAATAAAVFVGVLGLYTALGRHEIRIDAGSAAVPVAAGAVEFARADDGSVVIDFTASNRSAHRIVKTDDPRPTGKGEVKLAAGRRFVDRDEQVKPGEVVFYRID